MFRISFFLFIFSIVVNVSWSQSSSFTSVNNNQCPGNLFTLAADDNSLASYSWSVTLQGSGTSSSYNVNPVAFVLDNPGLYDISLTVSDVVGTSTTTELGFLEVYTNPIVDYAVSVGPYCAPATLDFTSTSTAGSGTIVSYVAFTDGTPYSTADFQHTYSSVGTYAVNVSIENSFGCVASGDLADIVVTEFPSLTSPLNPNTICSGSVFNYTPTSTIFGSTFSWVRAVNPDIAEVASNGVGDISEMLTSTSGSNVPVTYVVTNTSPGGCVNIQNVVVTVQPLPSVTIDDIDICTGEAGTLTATPSQVGGVYLWNTAATTQSISITTPGVYSVSYSVGSCASTPADAIVTETAPPSITGITIVENSGLLPDDGMMCKGSDVVTLTASASSGTGTFSWTPSGFGNSIDVSPNSTTTYTVVYTDGGCASAPFSQTITVFSSPTNNFSSTIINSCNSPVTTDYTSTSSGTIVWSFTGGTPATGAGQGPIPVTYNSSGVYGITMQNTSAQGCVTVSDFPTAIVIGNGFPPTSSFANTTPDVQCIEGNSFCFDYTGFGADTCQWDFGDGSPIELHDQDTVICHSYSELGSFTVTMIPFTTVGSALGCSGIGSTLTIELTGPVSAFTVSPLDCEDQLTRTYTSTSTGVSGTTQYTWDLESPTIQVTGVTSTTHTFSDYSPNFASPYIITLTVEDVATGCPPSIATQNILAYPNDQTHFESYTDISQATPSSEVCLGDELVFYNTTPLPQNTNPTTNSQDTQWDWTIDNGLQWFTSSEYRGSPEDLLYSPTALTTSGNVPWVPGVYTVSMRNRANNNGTYCYDTVAKQITVHGIIGDFTVPDTVCVDQVFDIVDNSTAPLTSIVSREWDWESDGIVDLSGNVSTTVHSFSTPGTYTISMTAEDEFGCPKTVTQTIVVREVLASFSIDRDFICNEQEITITNNNSISFGASSYQWIANTALSPTIPGTSSDFNPGSFLFDEQGVGSISLTLTDNLGCTDDTTISITVFDVFAAATGSPNSSSCFNPPTVVTFTNLSGNNVDATSYEWDFGNGETSTDEIPSTIYSLPGVFDVTLIVQSLTGGCADTTIVETINIGGPFGSIAVTNPVLDGCSCYAADIDLTTSDVAEATLLYGDGSFENITINSTETITHQYCNSGTTSQSLTPILFISSGTCNGNISATETVTIHPNPNVINPGNFEYCEGENIAEIPLTGSVPGAIYNWENDNVTIGLNANGAGNIASFTVQSPGGPDNVANIIVTPLIAATGCSGAAESFSLTVKNTAIADAGSAIVICAGSDVPLNGSFGGGATSASWTTTGSGIFDDANSLAATYTPSVDDIIAGTVTLTLTTDDPVGPCPANSSDVIVTINAGVTVNAGPAATICSDDTFTTSGTIGGSASSGEWNTSGTGLFIFATDPITVYVPSIADFLAGSVQLTLSTDDPGGPCSQSSSTMTLTFSDAATLTVDTPLESCIGTSVALNAVIGGSASGVTWSTSESGVFSDVNNLNPSYTPSNIENLGGQAIVTATVSDPDGVGPCLALTEDVLITLLDTVTLSAGPTQTICEGDDVSLNGVVGGSAVTGQWTLTDGLFIPDANNLNAIYTPSATDIINGSVELILTTNDPAGPCSPASDTVLITINPSPVLSSSASIDICSGNPVDYPITSNVSSTFTWVAQVDNTLVDGELLTEQNSSGIDDVLINTSVDLQTVNYFIFASAIGTGCVNENQLVSVNVSPVFTMDTPDNQLNCVGEDTDNVFFSSSFAGVSYQWTNDNLQMGLAASGSTDILSFLAVNNTAIIQTGVISVTPFIDGCAGTEVNFEITVNPSSIVNDPGVISECDGAPTSDIIFTGSDPSIIYNWTNTNVAIGLPVAGSGDILSFIATNLTNDPIQATIEVTPELNGCDGIAQTFTITVHPLPDVEAGTDTTLCFEQSITLTATGANNYAWDNGVINGVELFPSSTIMYNVVGTDTNLCQNTDSILVTYTLDLPPIVNAGMDTAICIGEDMLLAASGDAIIYLWNNGVIDGEVFVPGITNEYVVIGTAANGCVESDTVLVVVNPLPVIIAFASHDFICDGESTILWGEGADTYVWDQSVVDSIALIPSVTSTYTVVGFDLNGCTDTIEIEVIVNPLPDVLFSTNITDGGCLPFEPLFTDLTEGPASNSVMWYFGNGASSTQMGSVINTYDSYGCYDITLVSTTTEGCTDSLTQQNFVCVNEVNAEFQPNVYEQSVVNPIFEFTNSSTNATSFEWFFGDGAESDFVNTTHFYDSYGNYLVALVAMADDGCTDTTYVAITVVDEVLFYVPNSFTPNGDGQNDVFIPVLSAGYDRERGYEFSIYNRWGERVYFTDTPGEGWDATFNNKMVQNGTYTYYIKFKDSMNNEVYDYKGHVNVIK